VPLGNKALLAKTLLKADKVRLEVRAGRDAKERESIAGMTAVLYQSGSGAVIAEGAVSIRGSSGSPPID
jgi:hypothetical protein